MDESQLSVAAQKLLPALMALPLSDRLDLADLLYASIPPPPGMMCEDDPGFEAELERRLADLESGKTKGIPAEEVFRRLREERPK
jgi:putative addiction module component (TIGR02574 family)